MRGQKGSKGGGSNFLKQRSSAWAREMMLNPEHAGLIHGTTGVELRDFRAYMCPTSNKLHFSLVHL